MNDDALEEAGTLSPRSRAICPASSSASSFMVTDTRIVAMARILAGACLPVRSAWIRLDHLPGRPAVRVLLGDLPAIWLSLMPTLGPGRLAASLGDMETGRGADEPTDPAT